MGRLRAKELMSLPDGSHFDGDGLYLRVRGGSRIWVFRFMVQRNRHDISIGRLPAMSLAQARSRASTLRMDILRGEHPLVKRTIERTAMAEKAAFAAGASVTLEAIAYDAIEHKRIVRNLRTEKYTDGVVSTLRKNVFPAIGRTPLPLITPDMVATALKPYWSTTLGGTLLSGLRACFAYAKLKGYFTGTAPTEWKGCLQERLPPPPVKAVRHHAAAPWRSVPEIYRAVMVHKSSHPNAEAMRRILLITILTVPRISEMCLLRPSDVSGSTITIQRTKTSTEPVLVDLPRQAVPLLESMGDNYVFQAVNGGRLWGKDAMEFLREAVPGMDVTIHGFRASFSTWCVDNEKNPEVREACLKHTLGNRVVLSYMRSDLRELRLKLLSEWADFVTCSSAP